MTLLDNIVGQNLRILSQVMCEICQRSTLDEASEGELSRNQFTILKIISSQGELPLREIARILGISNAAASKNIERLVSLEMVQRKSDPDDRRRVALALRPGGHQIIQQHDEISGRKLSKLMDHFSVKEKMTLLDYLKRIIRFTIADEQDIDMVCFQCNGECGDECVVSELEGTCTLERRTQGAKP